MKYYFKVYKEKDGFWAQGVELIGCCTQGETVQELQENIQEALEVYLDEPDTAQEAKIVEIVCIWVND